MIDHNEDTPISASDEQSTPTSSPASTEYEDRRTLTEQIADITDKMGEEWSRMRGTIGPF